MSSQGNVRSLFALGVIALWLLVLPLTGCDKRGEANAVPNLAPIPGMNSEDPHWIHQSTPPAKVAVVFVHGLFGTTTGTWTNANGKSFFDLIKSASDVGEQIDVFAFGFTSTALAGGALDVRQAANKLEEHLTYRRIWDYDTVVFVGHSMGGLVIMQEIINHPNRRPQTPLVVLYATPQEGTQLAAIGRLFSKNPALGQMVPGHGSEFLKGLDDAWSRIPRGQRPKLVCAYETASVYGLPVVSQFSSTRFCDGARVAIGGADHLSIVKPDRQDHDSVIKLANALGELLGSPRDPRVEMPDFTLEGERLIYAWMDPNSQATAKLINAGPLPVRYVLGAPSSDKLMISPTNTPRVIAPGQVEELKFDLLLRGAWKDEYQFTLGTSIRPSQTVLVRVGNADSQQAKAVAAQQGMASDLVAFLESPENKQELLALSADEQQERLVQLAGQSMESRAPATSAAAQWVRTADALSSMGWPTLAVHALRNAERESPEIVRSPGVQVLSSDISRQSGNKAIFRESETPQVTVPDEFKAPSASVIDSQNAAVWSRLATTLQSVPSLQYYGLTLQGDVLQEQGQADAAKRMYTRAQAIKTTPELTGKLQAASGR
jgi:pimeloyl-ACP methyl ester carboxylesterase